MPIRQMTPIPARVVQVLKNFLLAETTLIDAEENDAIVTPQIPAANYFDYDRKLLAEFPACTIRALSSSPVDVKPNLMGSRVDGRHRLNVMFHATIAQARDGRTLEKLMQRWANGAARVLAILKDGLETSADPTRWGSPNVTTEVYWTEPITYGPESDQGDGTIVRTATLPINVRRIELR